MARPSREREAGLLKRSVLWNSLQEDRRLAQRVPLFLSTRGCEQAFRSKKVLRFWCSSPRNAAMDSVLSPYSPRKVCTGSTLVALRAGM